MGSDDCRNHPDAVDHRGNHRAPELAGAGGDTGDVLHRRVLDFGEPWTERSASRLQALRSERSTRLGAALRHATRALAGEPPGAKLVLAMTDGEPHDVDIHDPRYLPADARHAAQAAERVGVRCVGLLVAEEGTAVARQMFGAGRSAALGHVAALPAVLSRLLGR